MTLYLEAGGFAPWHGQAINDIRYPLNIEQLWTAAELAAIGLYSPAVPSVPAGKVVTSSRVARVDGVVTYVYTLESVPLADLNRIQFEFMIEKLGLASAIETALALMPDSTEAEQNAKIMARVLYRSGQKFERSHYLFTTLAPAVGLTTEQVDAAWAQALTV
jgi:hypothetical protein